MTAEVCVALLLLGCSEPVTASEAVDARPFVPEDLVSTELEGEGGLTLVAFTLQQRAAGLELLAAVRHEGEAPACEPGMLAHFIDRAGELQATVGATLHGGDLYRLDDAAGTLVRCLAPGQLGMAAFVGLPDQVAVEALAHLQHAFPAFTLSGLTRLDRGLTLTTAPSGGGYEGTLSNELDVAVEDPKVAIFSVNRASRPIGVVTSGGQLRLQPGEQWRFTTPAAPERGVEQLAYALASLNGDPSTADRE